MLGTNTTPSVSDGSRCAGTAEGPRGAGTAEGPRGAGTAEGPRGAGTALLRVLPAAALVVLALVLLVAPAFRADAPDDEDWQEAAHHVQAGWRHGDVVRLEPYWMTGGRGWFGDLDGGTREPFRILDLHESLDPPYLYHYQRLWLVAALDARDLPDALVPSGAELLEETPFADLTVFLFALPQGMLAWEMVSPPVAAAGPASGRGHRGWSQLGPGEEVRQVAGGARRCLVLKPGAKGVTREWEVPAEGELLVRFGNTLEAARNKDGSDTEVTVLAGGEEAAAMTLEKRDYRFHEVRRTLDGLASPVKLEVRVRAADPRRREICLDGYVLRSPANGDVQ